MLHILIHSILFFDTAGAKKRIKRNAVLRGVAPNPSRFFEKSDAKTFVSDNRVVAVICSGLTRLRQPRLQFLI